MCFITKSERFAFEKQERNWCGIGPKKTDNYRCSLWKTLARPVCTKPILLVWLSAYSLLALFGKRKRLVRCLVCITTCTQTHVRTWLYTFRSFSWVTRKMAIDTKKNGCWWRRPILQFRDCFQKKKRNVYVTFSLRGERRPFGFSLQGGWL